MNDPWIYLSAFGLLASAGLLIYLIGQLGAADAEQEADEDIIQAELEPDEDLEPEPEPAPQPRTPPKGEEVIREELEAVQAVATLMDNSLPEEPAAPAPQAQDKAPEPAPERPKADLSSAVSYLHALNEDIRTFHAELQAMSARFQAFSEHHDRQMNELAERLDRLDRPGKEPTLSLEGSEAKSKAGQ